jgi:hypothetical protein
MSSCGSWLSTSPPSGDPNLHAVDVAHITTLALGGRMTFSSCWGGRGGVSKRRASGSLVVSCSTHAALARALARAEPAILRVDPDKRDVRDVSFVDGLAALKARTRIAVQLTRDDDHLEAALRARGIDIVKPTRGTAPAGARWGPLELDATTLGARIDGSETPLSPQLFRLVSALVRAGGAIVPRAELLGAIGYARWPGYDLLGRALHRLREALGPAARFVRVERGRGVRLLAATHPAGGHLSKVLSLDRKSFPLRPEIRSWLAERVAVDGEGAGRPPAASRAEVSLLIDDGCSAATIAERTHRTVRSVRQLRARYLERGATCIDAAPRAGRPRRRV